ncbi:MAG: uroporphyrinogen decarboxylase family protein [Candidatus Hydrothermarchaeota archaeon]
MSLKDAINNRNEKLPVAPLVDVGYLASAMGIDLRKVLNNPKVYADILIESKNYFGYDWLWKDWFYEFAFEGKIAGDNMIFETELGIQITVPKKGYPWVSKHNSSFEFYDLRNKVLEDLRKRTSGFICGTVLGPFTFCATWMFELEDFLIKILSEPDMVKEWLKISAEFVSNCANVQLDYADAIFILDSASNPDIISSQVYKRYSYPFQKKILKKIKGDAILHICGDPSPIMREFLSLRSVPSFSEHTDISKIKKRPIMGNYSPERLIRQEKNGIVNEVSDLVHKIGKKGFILSTGSHIRMDTPPERLKIFVEAGRLADSSG